eukprot:2439683-Pyramimonas_sp.AAC.1
MPPSFETYAHLKYKSAQQPLRVIETPLAPHRGTIVVACTDFHLKLKCGKLCAILVPRRRLRDCIRPAAPDSPTPLAIASGWAGGELARAAPASLISDEILLQDVTNSGAKLPASLTADTSPPCAGGARQRTSAQHIPDPKPFGPKLCFAHVADRAKSTAAVENAENK